jgi:hypothetical protein
VDPRYKTWDDRRVCLASLLPFFPSSLLPFSGSKLVPTRTAEAGADNRATVRNSVCNAKSGKPQIDFGKGGNLWCGDLRLVKGETAEREKQ